MRKKGIAAALGNLVKVRKGKTILRAQLVGHAAEIHGKRHLVTLRAQMRRRGQRLHRLLCRKSPRRLNQRHHPIRRRRVRPCAVRHAGFYVSARLCRAKLLRKHDVEGGRAAIGHQLRILGEARDLRAAAGERPIKRRLREHASSRARCRRMRPGLVGSSAPQS